MHCKVPLISGELNNFIIDRFVVLLLVGLKE